MHERLDAFGERALRGEQVRDVRRLLRPLEWLWSVEGARGQRRAYCHHERRNELAELGLREDVRVADREARRDEDESVVERANLRVFPFFGCVKDGRRGHDRRRERAHRIRDGGLSEPGCLRPEEPAARVFAREQHDELRERDFAFTRCLGRESLGGRGWMPSWDHGDLMGTRKARRPWAGRRAGTHVALTPRASREGQSPPCSRPRVRRWRGHSRPRSSSRCRARRAAPALWLRASRCRRPRTRGAPS